MNANLQQNHERQEHRIGAWLGGLGLVLLGLVFLLNNLGYLAVGNWWALFILLPAAGGYINAYLQYRDAGRLTAAARGSLIGGVIFTLIATLLLFELDWGKLWPLFIIVAGISALLATIPNQSQQG